MNDSRDYDGRVKPTTFRIGEAAAHAGVSPDTLRYYERRGALPKAARTSAGYRVYSEEAVVRVQFARNALRFGFSLKLGTLPSTGRGPSTRSRLRRFRREA